MAIPWALGAALLGGGAALIGDKGGGYTEEQEELLRQQIEAAKQYNTVAGERYAIEKQYMEPMVNSVFQNAQTKMGAPRTTLWGRGIFEPDLKPRQGTQMDLPQVNWDNPTGGSPPPSGDPPPGGGGGGQDPLPIRPVIPGNRGLPIDLGGAWRDLPDLSKVYDKGADTLGGAWREIGKVDPGDIYDKGADVIGGAWRDAGKAVDKTQDWLKDAMSPEEWAALVRKFGGGVKDAATTTQDWLRGAMSPEEWASLVKKFGSGVKSAAGTGQDFLKNAMDPEEWAQLVRRFGGALGDAGGTIQDVLGGGWRAGADAITSLSKEDLAAAAERMGLNVPENDGAPIVDVDPWDAYARTESEMNRRFLDQQPLSGVSLDVAGSGLSALMSALGVGPDFQKDRMLSHEDAQNALLSNPLTSDILKVNFENRTSPWEDLGRLGEVLQLFKNNPNMPDINTLRGLYRQGGVDAIERFFVGQPGEGPLAGRGALPQFNEGRG